MVFSLFHYSFEFSSSKTQYKHLSAQPRISHRITDFESVRKNIQPTYSVWVDTNASAFSQDLVTYLFQNPLLPCTKPTRVYFVVL